MFIFIVTCSLTFSDFAYSGQLFKVTTITNAELLPSTIEKVRAAYQLLDIELEIYLLPAKRALIEAEKSNTYDAVLARIKNAEKQLPSFVRIPVKLRELNVVAVASRKFNNLSGQQGIANLKNYNIASLRGVILTDLLLKDIDNHIIDTPKQGFSMLIYKRIDVFVLPSFMTQDLPKELTENNYIIHEPPLYSANLYHYLHIKHSDIIPAITTAISKITGNPIEPP
ncbi:MAG: polar amino acid transport system substrate-binding protein [Oleiphilaceae bacterium]|jgi:ABC-type amino acid transport substrate-binding protein